MVRGKSFGILGDPLKTTPVLFWNILQRMEIPIGFKLRGKRSLRSRSSCVLFIYGTTIFLCDGIQGS